MSAEKLRFDFEGSSFDDWRDRVGADAVEGLVTTLEAGVTAEPAYATGGSKAAPRGARRLSAQPWSVAQSYPLRDCRRLAEAIVRDRVAGLDTAWIDIEPTISALDPRSVTGPGLHLAGVEDFRQLLDAAGGQVALQFDAGVGATVVMAGLAKAAGDQLAQLRGAVLSDPLGRLAQHGTLGTDLETAYASMLDATGWAMEHAPNLRTVLIDGLPYHDAGATPSIEISSVVGTALRYLRFFEQHQVPLASVAERMVVRLGSHGDLFADLAKIRATRMLFAGVLEQLHVDSPQPIHIGVRSGWRNKTRHDPWVNMLRSTLEAFAAATGGADEICTQPFDELYGPAEPDARRWALNTQHILRDESHLHHVIDPGGGSAYIEALTSNLARKAWARVQAIEQHGGMDASLKSGAIQELCAEAAAAAQKSLATGGAALSGVTIFPDLDEPRIPQREDPMPEVPRQLDAVGCVPPSVRGARTQSAVAMLSEVSLRELLSRPVHQPPSATRLERPRLAEPFEALRDRAQEHAAAMDGWVPVAWLVPVGSPRDHGPAVSSARAFAQLGGFRPEVVEVDAVADIRPIPGRLSVAVICGQGPGLSDAAAEVVGRLKERGVGRVLVTAKATDDLSGVGFAGFVHDQANALEIWQDLHASWEVGQ